MNVFISDLRDVIAWSLHGGEELIKPTRMRWNIFSVWWKGGNQKMLFALFPDQINSLQKNVLLFIKAQLLWVSGGLDCTVCSRDYTACSSTQHPPHLQTSRPHPLRKTEQPPLYSSRQSDVAVRRDQRTDSDLADFVSTIWSWHASDSAQDWVLDTKPASLMSCEIADKSDFGWPIN